MAGHSGELTWWLELSCPGQKEEVKFTFSAEKEKEKGSSFWSMNLDWPDYLIIVMGLVFAIICYTQYSNDDKIKNSWSITLFHFKCSIFNPLLRRFDSRLGKCWFLSSGFPINIFLAKVQLNPSNFSSLTSVNLLFSGLFLSSAVNYLFGRLSILLFARMKVDGFRSRLSSIVLLQPKN